MQKLKQSLTRLGIIASLLVAGAAGSAAIATQSAYAVDCSILPKSICDSADNKSESDSAIMQILKLVLTILTGMVGVAAVGGVIYAGIMYSSASGDAAQVKKAKQIIIDVVIGILAYGLMFIVLNWLIPGGVFG